MTLPAVPDYCVQADLERLLSVNGVVAFSDHDEQGTPEAGVIQDCIDQATKTIATLLWRRYDPVVLADSGLVTRWATVLACFYLTERRGNGIPASIAAEYERIMGDNGLLHKVAIAAATLPDVPFRAGNTPAFANLTIDRRFPRSKVRVITANSSDEPTVMPRDEAPDYVPHEY